MMSFRSNRPANAIKHAQYARNDIGDKRTDLNAMKRKVAMAAAAAPSAHHFPSEAHCTLVLGLCHVAIRTYVRITPAAALQREQFVQVLAAIIEPRGERNIL